MELRKKFIMRLNAVDTTAVLVRDGGGRVWVEVEGGERVEDALVLDGGRTVSIRHRGRMFLVDLTPPTAPEHRALVNGRGGLLQIFDELGAAAAAARAASPSSARELRADMPGLVVEVRCTVGDLLNPGMTVIVLEAMKMQNELASPGRVRVEEVHVRAGQSVESGALLVRFAEVEG